MESIQWRWELLKQTMNNASVSTTLIASARKVTNYGNGRVGTCVWWLNEWPQHVLLDIPGNGATSFIIGETRLVPSVHQHIVPSKWRHKNLHRNYSGFGPICHICGFSLFLFLLSLITSWSPSLLLTSQLCQYQGWFCSVSSVGLLHSRTRTWHCLHEVQSRHIRQKKVDLL